jgi:hypothetical protein
MRKTISEQSKKLIVSGSNRSFLNSLEILTDPTYGAKDIFKPVTVESAYLSHIQPHLEIFCQTLRKVYYLPWRNKSERGDFDPFILAEGCDNGRDCVDGLHESVTVRSVQTLWSSAAYSLLNNILHQCYVVMANKEDSEATNIKQGGGDNNLNTLRDESILMQLLSSARHASAFFSHPNDYEMAILTPFQNLIEGKCSPLYEGIPANEDVSHCSLIKIKETSADIFSRMVTDLPYMTVGTSAMPNPRRIAMILSLCEDHSVCHPSHRWGILHQPLLSQDLHAITMAGLSCIDSPALFDDFLCIMILAKLAQIICQPYATGLYKLYSWSGRSSNIPKSTNHSSVSDNDMIKYLTLFQSYQEQVLKIIHPNFDFQQKKLLGFDLVAYVFDEWYLFMLFLCHTKRLQRLCYGSLFMRTEMTFTQHFTSSQQLPDKLTYEVKDVEDMFRYLSDTEIFNVLTNNCTLALISNWAKQYRAAYKTHDFDRIAVDVPISLAPNNMRPRGLSELSAKSDRKDVAVSRAASSIRSTSSSLDESNTEAMSPLLESMHHVTDADANVDDSSALLEEISSNEIYDDMDMALEEQEPDETFAIVDTLSIEDMNMPDFPEPMTIDNFMDQLGEFKY